MRSKKNILGKLLVSSLIIITGLALAPHTFALKKAVFPDGKLLEPKPTNSHANISGNINSSTNDAADFPDATPEQSGDTSTQANVTTDENITPDTTQTDVTNEISPSFFINWFLIIVGIIFILVLGFYFYKKKKRSKFTNLYY